MFLKSITCMSSKNFGNQKNCSIMAIRKNCETTIRSRNYWIGFMRRIGLYIPKKHLMVPILLSNILADIHIGLQSATIALSAWQQKPSHILPRIIKMVAGWFLIPWKGLSFCECFLCMCFLKVLYASGTMEFSPVEVRKKRWIYAENS